ncbi:MAG: DNA-3-methyladenine glycosylase [Betaproteobacteria bacterium RBG_16_64_18]|nr:MAG: DNA-3-methyladenine glycosylase [Betaproteobacteria bacterium RBG_16_64_18]
MVPHSVPEYWSRAKRSLARRDPVLAGIMRAHPSIALRSRGDAFATLARSVVGQQISVKAADSVWRRLSETVVAVQPATVLQAGAAKLRACGLSQRKVEYLTDLAGNFANGAVDPAGWTVLDDETVIGQLTRVRGVGRWTAEMVLIFGLLRPNVLPLDDLGLQRAVGLRYFAGRRVSARTIRRLALNWEPWRSVATWYLWRSLDPVPVEY